MNNVDRAEEIIRRSMTHQIIRTADELEALDPDTLLIGCGEGSYHAFEAVGLDGGALWPYVENFPAAVVATGDQVRAARKAREGDNV